MDDLMEKQRRLEALAKTDTSYTLWHRTYQDCAKAFENFVNQQPEEIRNILWGYAEAGRLMNQRLVNLACENMDWT